MLTCEDVKSDEQAATRMDDVVIEHEANVQLSELNLIRNFLAMRHFIRPILGYALLSPSTVRSQSVTFMRMWLPSSTPTAPSATGWRNWPHAADQLLRGIRIWNSLNM